MSVKEQYENYPYPLRTPADDQQLIHEISPLEQLDVINHYGFGGKRNLNKPLRMLVAGGGTGDASLLLGYQLARKNPDSRVVYIDLSSRSTGIAKERTRNFALENTEFITGSLLDLPEMNPGSFDYINCSGVLHHLPNPQAGLDALTQVLAPDGAMGIMLYGALGRSGVYPAQQLLRLLVGGQPLEQQLQAARRILPKLPPAHDLKKNSILDYRDNLSDEEVVDRFLHSCDRAYTVDEILELAAASSMFVVDFVPELLYHSEVYVRDPALLERIAALPKFQRYRAVELAACSHERHSFFLTKQQNLSQPQLDKSAIPMLLLGSGPDLAELIQRTRAIRLGAGNLKMSLPFTISREASAILRCVDNQATLGEIHRRSTPQLSWPRFLREFEQIYGWYHLGGLMMLRFQEPERATFQ